MSGEIVDTLEIDGAEVTMRWTENEIPPWTDDGIARRRYSIQVKTDLGSESFPFWGSEHDMREGEHADIIHAVDNIILDAFYAYDCEDIDDFAAETGGVPEGDEISDVIRRWEAVQETAEKLANIGLDRDALAALGGQLRELDA